jgi:3,4-dihydroxy-2-butanone 4-phosphate synthase
MAETPGMLTMSMRDADRLTTIHAARSADLNSGKRLQPRHVGILHATEAACIDPHQAGDAEASIPLCGGGNSSRIQAIVERTMRALECSPSIGP